MLVGKNGGGDVSLPWLVNSPGDAAGFMAARGSLPYSSSHTANAPAMVSFVPCFLQPSHPACWFLPLSQPLCPLTTQGTDIAACVAGWWVQLAFQPDQFLVLICDIAMQTVMPTKKGELVQSGNNQPEMENIQIGLRSPASTCEAAAWIACSN